MTHNEWWRGGVFYQIYPRSFFDSNKDGIGDLPGITAKLDYVADLGVDAIWISPFFKSPMADFGYDVSDYRSVDPIFGVNADFEKLLDKAHRLGLKIIIDMVLSHTSHKHPWFAESRQGPDNPKSDWYIWADAKADGTPPNNWQSVFGGPAWTFDTRRRQYYMHNFLKEQPDLNFHNPEVQDAALAECRYWLERRVDGFRFDVANYYFHDKKLRDNPPRNDGDASKITQFEKKTPHGMQKHLYTITQPENLDFLARIRALMNEYPGTMTLGEVGAEEPYYTSAQYSQDDKYLNTCYNTHFMSGQRKEFTAALIRGPIDEFASQPFASWPSWAFSNHDVVRAVTRWNADPKLLIALLCSLRGTPFLYEGDELGLPEATIPYEKLQDPWGKYLWPEWQGRDGCRTPMPWDGRKKNAGFTKAAQPWLPVGDGHKELAVARQEKDKNSTLRFTRRFLTWRREQPALTGGDMKFHQTDHEKLLCFTRHGEGQNLLCLFNLSDKERTATLPVKCNRGNLFDAGRQSGMIESDIVTLPPFGMYFASLSLPVKRQP